MSWRELLLTLLVAGFIGACSAPPADDGQTIHLKLWLPDEFTKTLALANDYLLLQGKVKNYSPKVGFSLQFDGLSEGESEILAMLVGHYAGKP